MKIFENKINKWIIKNKLTTHIHVATKVNVNHTLIPSIPQYMNYSVLYRSQEIVEGAVYM